MSELLNQLSFEEKISCFKFIDKQLEKGTSLAGIRVMLEKRGYEPVVSRELVKIQSLKHAKNQLTVAYSSLGIGILICTIILFTELSHPDHMKFGTTFFYGLGSLVSGIVAFFFFFRRYNYLRKLD